MNLGDGCWQLAQVFLQLRLLTLMDGAASSQPSTVNTPYPFEHHDVFSLFGADRPSLQHIGGSDHDRPDTQTLFSSWLSDEADQANTIKRDSPVMVVIGNPPYSVSSSNKSPWIESLTADYKKDMKERNIQPLSDDYIKFIRFGQHFIDNNGEGILAYISNNSFVDGIIHRQMRKHLLESFDKIYILDLHGNSKKKEVCLDGSPDQNVFDIMQGVSINIFIKTGNKKKNELGEVLHYDLQGKRDFKYTFLNDNNLKKIKWNLLDAKSPNHFFINKSFLGENNYLKGFSTNDIFKVGSSGIKTERDSLTIQFSEKELINITNELQFSDTEEFRKKHQLKVDGRDWKLQSAKDDLNNTDKKLTRINYRPFDFRFTYYTGKTKGFHAYPRKEVSDSMIGNENYGLINLRQNNIGEEYVILITNLMTEKGSLVCGNYFINPLYLYPENNNQQTLDGSNGRVPNIDKTIANQIAKGLGAKYVPDLEDRDYAQPPEGFDPQLEISPLSILDYIYAVLHSPTYRETYKEFLKIDFPRVPYPKDSNTFWELVQLGGELRQIHLLESSIVEKYITQYPEDGDNIVTKPVYKNGNVYINETQYFANVPEVAWNFYIGGYQPAQKWLKDRKDRELGFEDILHYQKIIVALTETDRIMKEIDKIEI